MPIVSINMVEGEFSEAQYAQLIEEITEVVGRVLGKNPATTHVYVNPIPATQWGIGGTTVKKLRG